MTAKQNSLLPIGVSKCQHLPTWFAKSPKWKRFQAVLGLLPPHYGKCQDLLVKPRYYQSSVFYSNTYTYIYVRTSIHKCVDVHTRAHTHIYARTNTYKCVYVHTRACTYIYIHTRACTYIYKHTRACTYIYIHTYTCMHVHIHTYIHVHARTYTYIHTRKYTYIQEHVHLSKCFHNTVNFRHVLKLDTEHKYFSILWQFVSYK